MNSEPASKLKDRRKVDRVALFADCEIQHRDNWYRCALADISVRGAKIYSDLAPTVGEILQLKIAHLSSLLEGTVVRTFQDGFAVIFDPSEAKKVGLNDMLTVALNNHLALRD